jgi:hypothetical protein
MTSGYSENNFGTDVYMFHCSSSNWSRRLPRLLVVPGAMELTTLGDDLAAF